MTDDELDEAVAAARACADMLIRLHNPDDDDVVDEVLSRVNEDIDVVTAWERTPSDVCAGELTMRLTRARNDVRRLLAICERNPGLCMVLASAAKQANGAALIGRLVAIERRLDRIAIRVLEA